jgi:hypothetical protein
MRPLFADPPQTIISLPVHTALWESRASGALAVVVGVQLSVPALYLPPVLKSPPALAPPQTIISLPVHTPVGPDRGEGALTVLVRIQLSVLGSYLPPVFVTLNVSSTPLQTIISSPVHTAL